MEGEWKTGARTSKQERAKLRMPDGNQTPTFDLHRIIPHTISPLGFNSRPLTSTAYRTPSALCTLLMSSDPARDKINLSRVLAKIETNNVDIPPHIRAQVCTPYHQVTAAYVSHNLFRTSSMQRYSQNGYTVRTRTASHLRAISILA